MISTTICRLFMTLLPTYVCTLYVKNMLFNIYDHRLQFNPISAAKLRFLESSKGETEKTLRYG